MATLTHKYDLRNPVLIKPIDNLQGVIIAVHLSIDGLQYYVRYFANSKMETEYFYGHELELDKKRFIDFHGETELERGQG